jgi:hypothetical protein
MTFWDGTRWVHEPTKPQSHRSRLGDRAATTLMVLGLIAIAMPLGLVGAARPSPAGCSVNTPSAAVGDPYVVSAWGLPTGTAINLWVTEGGSTTGAPLGSTPYGTFNLQERSSVAGTTTYAFSGPTKKNHTVMYATCSVDAY